MRLTIAAAALALLPSTSVSAAADPARFMPAELIAQTLSPQPGTTLLVGFRMVPKAGWHGYWSNPGDSGIAPSVEWSAPKGVSFGPLLHPAPSLITADGVSSFVHEGRHILLSRMTVPRGIALGTPIPVQAKLSWAACTASQCVPLHATLTLEFVVGDGQGSAELAALRSAERALPREAPRGAFSSDGRTVRLTLPAKLRIDPRAARFFPDDNDAFRTAAARIQKDGSIVAPFAALPPSRITGVVTDGRRAFRIAFDRTESKIHAETVAAPVPAPEQASREMALPAPEPRQSQAAPAAKTEWPWLAIGIVIAGALASGLVLRGRKRR